MRGESERAESFQVTLVGCGSDSGQDVMLDLWCSEALNKLKQWPIDRHSVRTTTRTGRPIMLRITDISEIERYGSNIPSCYHRANGVILVFKPAEEDAFEDLKSRMKFVVRYADEVAQIMIVVNRGESDIAWGELGEVQCEESILEHVKEYASQNEALLVQVDVTSPSAVLSAVSLLGHEMAIAAEFVNREPNNCWLFSDSRVTWALCRRAKSRGISQTPAQGPLNVYVQVLMLPEDLFSRVIQYAFPPDVPRRYKKRSSVQPLTLPRPGHLALQSSEKQKGSGNGRNGGYHDRDDKDTCLDCALQ
eukprot:TRINITY_DN2388_c0_g4_i4.p1 TRINITY_DN2388_c0_g4~~TRINITY_DN2388_c0_g4_i4.p1  ORF type:complete len:306 (+),score=37.26 TRINITY_DN2388_c0_g4_i4:48-965(+)